MRTPAWRRLLVTAVSAILIMEAGAYAPASLVLAAPAVGDVLIRDSPQTAPRPPAANDNSAVASNTICDDFERPDDPDDLGVGPLGLWENPAQSEVGGVSLVGGEARFVVVSDFYPTRRGVEDWSLQAPFDIRLKHRMLYGNDNGNTLNLATWFGLSESGFLQATEPPSSWYRL